MEAFLKTLAGGRPLVSDGAWGTMLQAAGLPPGQCPEIWNLENPGPVAAIARAYAEAGADLVETNSFGGSRLKLAHYGLEARTGEINEMAARLSREAADSVRPGILVIGSVGPTGEILLMEEVEPAEMFEDFAAQVEALERGGADAICVETMSAIDEEEMAAQVAALVAAGCTLLGGCCGTTPLHIRAIKEAVLALPGGAP